MKYAWRTFTRKSLILIGKSCENYLSKIWTQKSSWKCLRNTLKLSLKFDGVCAHHPIKHGNTNWSDWEARWRRFCSLSRLTTIGEERSRGRFGIALPLLHPSQSDSCSLMSTGELLKPSLSILLNQAHNLQSRQMYNFQERQFVWASSSFLIVSIIVRAALSEIPLVSVPVIMGTYNSSFVNSHLAIWVSFTHAGWLQNVPIYLLSLDSK